LGHAIKAAHFTESIHNYQSKSVNFVMPFQHYMPTRLIFGPGSFATASSEICALGRKTLLVTGQSSMQAAGFGPRIIQELTDHGVDVYRFSQFSNGPTTDEVDRGVQMAREQAVDLIVALGGGSAMDCGKAIAGVVATNGSAADALYRRTEITDSAVPLVCIPSTAGTGAEMNRSAIITDTSVPFKDGIRSDAIFPKIAIVDSELTWSLPQQITATTGFDVLAHAIESFVSPKSSPLTDALSLRAIENVAHWLPVALAEPQHPQARDEMALASTLMGINLACVGTCFPHRADKSLCSLRTEIAHGQSVALFYPYWLASIESAAADRLNAIADAWNKGARWHFKNDDRTDFVPTCRELILQFISDIGLSSDLRQFGVDEADIPALVHGVAGDLSVNPLPLQKKMLPDIFRKILQGEFHEHR
jgi:alcohol dehydrogenase class IV